MVRRAAALGLIVAGVIAIAWWNWRMYYAFADQGINRVAAAVLVFGPLAAVAAFGLYVFLKRRRGMSR